MKLLSKEKDILSIKDQYALFDEVLKERIQTVMPKVLRDCGVDAWLVLCREYNEDPVFKTITPMLVKNASRVSCFLFSQPQGGEFEAVSLSRPNPRLAPFYTQAYSPKEETQWEAIQKAVESRGLQKIAVNVSEDCAQSDGLTKYLWDKLSPLLGDRLVPDEQVAVRWLETRTKRELQIYPQLYRISMDVLREAYSTDVITPGKTTTTDVEWYIMQRINDMGLDCWFAPDVDLQRQGGTDQRMSGVVIQKGDLLHTDMGLSYLCGLYTDSQRLAYVLKDGETEVPAGIMAGFRRGNRFQDIVRENFKTGLTGNQIFTSAVAQAKAEGIRPQLYSHPIGLWGHGAGPSVGMYDNQGFVPGHGEYILHDDTCYALELNITEKVPEWDNQDVCFMLEETISYTGGKTYFMDGDRDKVIAIG